MESSPKKTLTLGFLKYCSHRPPKTRGKFFSLRRWDGGFLILSSWFQAHEKLKNNVVWENSPGGIEPCQVSQKPPFLDFLAREKLKNDVVWENSQGGIEPGQVSQKTSFLDFLAREKLKNDVFWEKSEGGIEPGWRRSLVFGWCTAWDRTVSKPGCQPTWLFILPANWLQCKIDQQNFQGSKDQPYLSGV